MGSILMSVVWLFGSLWGLLPLIPAVRQFATTNLQRRIGMMALSVALAFIPGTIIMYWSFCHFMVTIFAWPIEIMGDSSPIPGVTNFQIISNIIPTTNQLVLQSTILRNTCLSSTPEVCKISKHILENGFNTTGVLTMHVGCLLFLLQ